MQFGWSSFDTAAQLLALFGRTDALKIADHRRDNIYPTPYTKPLEQYWLSVGLKICDLYLSDGEPLRVAQTLSAERRGELFAWYGAAVPRSNQHAQGFANS